MQYRAYPAKSAGQAFVVQICQMAEMIYFSDKQLTFADTNGDGKVDIGDATHLQKYLAEFDGIVLGKQN